MKHDHFQVLIVMRQGSVCNDKLGPIQDQDDVRDDCNCFGNMLESPIVLRTINYKIKIWLI